MHQTTCERKPRASEARWLAPAIVAALAAGCDLLPPAPLPPGTTVALQPVAENLTSPVKLVAPPDGSGRLFVVDQIGLIRIIDAGGNLLPEPFIDLSSRMVSVGIDFGDGLVFDERGLLGLAFHPDYARNGRFFVFYSAPPTDQTPAGFNCENRVAEFAVSTNDPNRADESSERILLRIQKPQFNHNGGDLVFGPDRKLYISVGDGGAANDVGDGHTPNLGNAQDKGNLLGKILRIDVDRGDPYAIPPDNPFAFIAGARGEIWAYGLRNPFRISFDRGGTRRLFAADVGQDLFEEVDIIVRGGNYGWNFREGTHCFDPDAPGTPPGSCPVVGVDLSLLRTPIVDYPHVDPAGGPMGISAIGGFVYRGSAVPELQRRYIFGDFSRGFFVGDGSLFAATEQFGGLWSLTELVIADRPDGRIGRFVLGFGEDDAGEIYLLTSDNLGPLGSTGRVFRIVASP
jgi:glucose/arabinose dehydrogenase